MDFKDNECIRQALTDEWEPAMELCWRTFLKYEAPVYSKEGTENFLNFISDEQLYKMFLNGDYKVFVAVKDNKIVGVGSLRAGSHISLLFVDEKYHRQGIGRKLIKEMQKSMNRTLGIKMTVNASPYGEEFYHKLGFIDSGDKVQTDGIIYTPMTLFYEL